MNATGGGGVPDPTGFAGGPEHDGAEIAGEEVGLAGDWAVPWSDLMMVMFVLFVVLFTYQVAERPLGDAVRKQDAMVPEAGSPFREPGLDGPRARTLYLRATEAIREAEVEDVEAVLESDDTVRLSVRGPLYFDLGQADLKPETMRFLDRIATILGDADHRVRVVGHTDTFPISSERFPTNWELSAVRATTVARYLIERGRLDPARFSIVGHSMYRPAVPNDTVENKARNRRVEIVISAAPEPRNATEPS